MCRSYSHLVNKSMDMYKLKQTSNHTKNDGKTIIDGKNFSKIIALYIVTSWLSIKIGGKIFTYPPSNFSSNFLIEILVQSPTPFINNQSTKLRPKFTSMTKGLYANPIQNLGRWRVFYCFTYSYISDMKSTIYSSDITISSD